MWYRNHKCFIYCMLSLLCAGVLLTGAGCSDNPEDAATKRVSQKTTKAIQTSVKEKDYKAAQDQINKVMVDRDNSQASGDSKDAAHLASGNLILARGRQMQADLELKVWKKLDSDSKDVSLNSKINDLEKTLRSCEELLLEKERIEKLLASGQQEMVELEQLLVGGTEQAGLKKQLQVIQGTLNNLQDQKEQKQTQKNKVQTVLDDFQSQAAAYMRKAEMAEGDEKLKLEKEGFAVLQNRKQYYIQAQAFENEIAVLDGKIELVQTQLDGLKQSIQETEQRISTIDNSQTRILLKRQQHENGQTISVNQQKMTTQAGAITAELNTCTSESENICGIFEMAAGEFESIRSRDAEFTAKLRLADSYHSAALTCSSSIKLQMNISERMESLMETADPTFSIVLQGQLPIRSQPDQLLSQKAISFFDKADEAYEQALSRARTLDKKAECSTLKSYLLSIHGKMMLADSLGMSQVVDQAVAQKDELMEKGREFGVMFTQSETVKLLEFGIYYAPSLPINLDALAEDLIKQLGAWKRLPVAEQETAVQANLIEIEKVVEKYGEELARKLEPLKQEMLAAQSRGFEETAANGRTTDPNSL